MQKKLELAFRRAKIVDDFEKMISYEFKDKDLLERAMTHISRSRLVNNERLEFLGDRVLSLAISHILFERFSLTEGELSGFRSSLENNASLARKAKSLNFINLIHVSDPDLFENQSVLAGCFEALIGAVYLDCENIKLVIKVVEGIFRDELSSDFREVKAPKTQLQELLQGAKLALPVYSLIKTQGRDNERIFTVSCSIDSLQLKEISTSRTIENAQTEAASKLVPLVKKILSKNQHPHTGKSS